MIKNHFGIYLPLCIFGMQGLDHIRRSYENPERYGYQFYIGIGFCVGLCIFLVGVLISLREQAGKPTEELWLDVAQYRMLILTCLVVTAVLLLQASFLAFSSLDNKPISLWFQIGSTLQLLLSSFAARQVWSGFFVARRLIRERGFAPKEAKNGMA